MIEGSATAAERAESIRYDAPQSTRAFTCMAKTIVQIDSSHIAPVGAGFQAGAERLRLWNRRLVTKARRKQSNSPILVIDSASVRVQASNPAELWH